MLRRTVAEDGVHADAVFHVHHAAGLANSRFARVEFDFHELHVIAMKEVINLVHACIAHVLCSHVKN